MYGLRARAAKHLAEVAIEVFSRFFSAAKGVAVEKHVVM
jgi:hypothetical protein